MAKKGNKSASAATGVSHAQYEEDMNALKEEIQRLKTEISTIKYDYTVIRSKLEVSNQVTNVLKEQLDNVQQYTRRNTIVLDNVPVKRNESIQQVEEEVQKILVNQYKVDKDELNREFDKAHRLGKPDEKNKQSIVIHSKSHSYGSNLYVKRKQYQKEKGSYKLRVALTGRRQELLAETIKKIDGNVKVAFAYANVNGDLKVRLVEKLFNKDVFDIKKAADIDNLLLKLNCREAQQDFDDQFNQYEEDNELNVADNDIVRES